jgi:hypothetical protein
MASDGWLHHRPVRPSDEFTAKAQRMFPVGGSDDGTPSYGLFCETVYLAAMMKFGRDFESCLTENEGIIGVVLTAETQLFRRPMAFYARLVDDGTAVEMVDVEIDRDWIDWDLVLPDDGDELSP